MAPASELHVDIAVIGFHKCGSTALFEMLGQHPDLCSHPGGQWPFFLEDDDYLEQYPRIMREQFGHCSPGAGRLLRDNSLSQDLQSLARFHQLNPDAVLVLSLRDPADRAYSAYWHAVERGFDEDTGFDEVIRRGVQEGPGASGVHLTNYLGMSLYHRALTAIETIYPRHQIVLLRAQDLRDAPVASCAKVFAAAGLRPFEVEGQVRNTAISVRSRRFGRLLQGDSWPKRAVRSAVPLRVRVRARSFLQSLNAKAAEHPPMTSAQRAALHDLFADERHLVRQDYGIEL